MRYPVYPTQPSGGDLPSMADMGPPDLRPSSSTAPFYQRKFDMMTGRHLAGSDETALDEEVSEGTALNELRVMEALDDHEYSGIFDPPGTRPNINPTEGVLAARYGIPGYLARERSFAPSEVLDATTGRPIVTVPAGWTVADDASRVAFIENQSLTPSGPVLLAQGARRPRRERTDDGTLVARAVEGLGSLPSSTLLVLGLGLAGVAAGLVYAMRSQKKLQPNRRRRHRR